MVRIMESFHNSNGQLYCEVVSVTELVARFGTPLYVYSKTAILETFNALKVAFAAVVELIGRLRRLGHPIEWYNMEGGYGINYRGSEARPVGDFAQVIVPRITASHCRLAIEPGRVMVGNAGILVSRVLYTKQSGEKRFLIQDAAMNDLIRPALYESFHRIWPVTVAAGLTHIPDESETNLPGTKPWDVVGPVCESGDLLAKDRPLPQLPNGALIATFSAGAYGVVMASNYNTRPRAPKVLVARSEARLVRRRETLEDLVRQEVDML
jgi:diaminopimelate decarboxylase